MSHTENQSKSPVQAQSQQGMDKRDLWVTKLKLILIILVFGLPLLAAMVMAQLSREGLPDFMQTTNYGEFVDPVVPLTGLNLTSKEGKPVRFNEIEGYWTLAYLSPQGCNQLCQQQVFAMRQLRLMNGKNIDRIKRLFVYQGLTEREWQSMRDAFPGMLMATGNTQQFADIQALFGQQNEALKDRLFLIDPKGNLMMSYPKDINPRHIYFDMKKLLKVMK